MVFSISLMACSSSQKTSIPAEAPASPAKAEAVSFYNYLKTDKVGDYETGGVLPKKFQRGAWIYRYSIQLRPNSEPAWIDILNFRDRGFIAELENGPVETRYFDWPVEMAEFSALIPEFKKKSHRYDFTKARIRQIWKIEMNPPPPVAN